MKKLYILLCFSLATSIILAQTKTTANLFALNVGNFANPEIADFAALQKFGLVYAVPYNNDQSTIFAGDFADKMSANAALSAAKKAFPEAYVAQKKATTKTFSVVQIFSKKVGEKINWKAFENAGNVCASSDGKIVRIFSAGFPNDSIAKIAADDLRKIGYKDAVLRKIPEVNLHKISFFESGLALDKAISKPVPKPAIIPKQYSEPDPYAGNYPISELKRALSTIGTYKGIADDKVDATLDKAFEEAKIQDKNLTKYAILAKVYEPTALKISDLQKAINNLPKDTMAAKVLSKSTQPIAKAYRAYSLFTQNGDSKTINTLMNDAIKTAFKGVKNPYAFDPTAIYDYKSLEQLIKHLAFIQGVSKEEIAAPNWLFEEHPTIAKTSFLGNYKLEGTDPAMNIEAVRMAKVMADDLVATAKKDIGQEQKDIQYRTKQLLMPQAVTENQDDWNKSLWKGLDAWAAKDALNQQMFNAFKATYYQATLQLQKELAKNLKNTDENTLRNSSLAIMKTIVAKPLQAYGRQSPIK